MVRVATLLKKFRAGVDGTSPDGLNTEQQLHAIRQRAAQMLDDVATCWQELLRPLLDSEAIRFLEPADYTAEVKAFLAGYFKTHIWPVLTPLAFDPGHPFPYISNLSHSFAVVVRHSGRTKFARVKVPDKLPRFVAIPERKSARGSADRPDADLRVHRRRDPAEHPGAVPGHAGQERAPVPHRPRHRHGDPGRRGRRPARERGPQPPAAALRRAVAAAGRSQHAAAGARHPGRELRGRRGRRPAHVRPAGVCRLHGADRRCTGRR